MLGVFLNYFFTRFFFVCRKEKPATHFKTDAWIERIVILGISNSPKVIILTTEGMLQ